MYRLHRIFNPEIFQGKNQIKNYFEGWYYKCADNDCRNIMAFIPGVSIGSSLKDSHSFIQVIDGTRNRSGYFRFPFPDFKYSEDRLDLKIGDNSFSENGLAISLKNKDMSYSGALNFFDSEPFPKSFLNPGIMGPFSFLSFMQCYHGVVHLQHRLAGSLEIDGQTQDFTGGTGYIEKDWGTSFPDAWVWVQCNHFTRPDVSFMLSFAHIPFPVKSFTGLISFLSVSGRLYRLSTYQGARVARMDYQNNMLSMMVESRHHVLSLTVAVEPGSRLKAPEKGNMITNIAESMTSGLDLYFIEKNGKSVFTGKGKAVGVEISGDLAKLC